MSNVGPVRKCSKNPPNAPNKLFHSWIILKFLNGQKECSWLQFLNLLLNPTFGNVLAINPNSIKHCEEQLNSIPFLG